MSISYAGIVLVLGHEGSLEGRNVALGATLIFLSALAYAIYLTYSGELVRRLGVSRSILRRNFSHSA